MTTRCVQRICLLLFCLTGSPSTGALASDSRGSEVAVVYSRRIPASKEVALYYAMKRGVPTNQLIEVDVPMGEVISRSDFRSQLERPIRRALDDLGLLKFNAEVTPSTFLKPGVAKYTCREAKIRYLVMTWGLPFRIAPDPGLGESDPKLPQPLQRNEACVDNDLCLLPILGNFNYLGVVPNRFAYQAQNTAQLHPTNSLLMVTRLDGPTPELAKGLVDKAIEAESRGLWGRAYFDLRSIGGEYALGDRFITNAATAVRAAGFETFIDTKPETLPASFPLSQCAIYAGWYTGHADGPFAKSVVEFVPGAIGYHLFSFSAQALRSTNVNWVGPMITKGVTATLGSTDEPYLGITPDIGSLFPRLLAGWTFAESAYSSLAGLSWQTIIIGDPLYRPFEKNPIQWVEILEASESEALDWALVRKVNFYLQQDRDRRVLFDYLLEQSIAPKSSVIQEKLGSMEYFRANRLEAIKRLENAANLKCSPMTRLRLLLQLADWQSDLEGQKELAFLNYKQVLYEFPTHVDGIEIRRKQLALARELKKTEEIFRLEAEIK